MVAAMASRVGNPLRKLVLIKLADQANDQGECWPSFAHIADQCEMSRRSVIGHIKALEGMGFLTTERRAGEKGNSSNVYHLHIHKAAAIQTEKEQKGSANSAPALVQEVHQGSAGDSPPLVQEIHQGSANAAPPLVQELHPESVSFESVIESKDKTPLSPCGEKDLFVNDAPPEKPKKSPPRKTRLPDDFLLTPERASRACDHWQTKSRGDLSALDEFDKFRNHHTQHGKAMACWESAWRTWYANAVTFSRPPVQQQRFLSANEKLAKAAESITDYEKSLDF